MLTRPITVAETAVFIRQAAGLWSDEELSEFVDFIARNPEAGDLIPASGGVRKVKWSRGASENEAECGSSTSIAIRRCRFTC